MPIGFYQRPDRRRYSSHLRDRISRTREYYYSLFTTLMVKIILFVFLSVLFVRTVRIMRTSFKNISNFWRYVLPAAIVVIALILGYRIYCNIKDIQRYNREMSDARKAAQRK